MNISHNVLLAGLLGVVLAGCASTEFQTATAPISSATSSQINEGVDTRTDIIAMFGAPNGLAQSTYSGGFGYYLGNGGSNSAANDQGDLLSYRDCTVKSAAEVDAARTTAATAASVVTLGLSSWVFGAGAKNSTVEECKMLAILLDEREVVDAYGYVESSLFTEERIGNIEANRSTKADVIRFMSVPSSITAYGSDEVLTYKNCLTQGESGMSVIKRTNQQRSICQQASFIIDRDSQVVSRVTHIPFPAKT